MTNEGKGRRPGVKPPQKRFKKLKDLKCFPEVDRRIRQGYPLIDVARYIQEDREEYQDVKPDSLVSVLSEFRDALPPGEVVAMMMPKAFVKAQGKLEDGLNELDRLRELYLSQLARVEVFITQEKDLGIVLPNRFLTGDVELLMKILQASASLKMDLGVTQRELGKLSVESKVVELAEERFGSRVAKTLGDPEARRKIIHLVDRAKRLKEMDKEGLKEFGES